MPMTDLEATLSLLNTAENLIAELNELTPPEREILDEYIGCFITFDEAKEQLTALNYEADAIADARTDRH